MLRLAADENLDNDILRGLVRWRSELYVVRVQDAGLAGADVPTVLDWAAPVKGACSLLTHDVSTLTKHVYERVRGGLVMSGVFEVALTAPVGRIIDDLLLVVECGLPEEWEGQVRYLPL